MTTPVGPDRRPPAPGTLTATAISAHARSTSAGAQRPPDVAVTGYQVERCQGAGCSNFAQIATPTGHQLQRHRTHGRTPATATASAPSTPPATSARTPTPPPRFTGLTISRPRDVDAHASRGRSSSRAQGVSRNCHLVGRRRRRRERRRRARSRAAGLYTPPAQRRHAHHHGDDARRPVGERHRLRHATTRARSRSTTTTCATGENLNETVLTPSNVNSTTLRQAVQLPARRPDVRLTALRRERHHPGPGRPQRRLRRDGARQRLRLRRRRAEQHAALEGLVHQPGRRHHADTRRATPARPATSRTRSGSPVRR